MKNWELLLARIFQVTHVVVLVTHSDFTNLACTWEVRLACYKSFQCRFVNWQNILDEYKLYLQNSCFLQTSAVRSRLFKKHFKQFQNKVWLCTYTVLVTKPMSRPSFLNPNTAFQPSSEWRAILLEKMRIWEEYLWLNREKMCVELTCFRRSTVQTAYSSFVGNAERHRKKLFHSSKVMFSSSSFPFIRSWGPYLSLSETVANTRIDEAWRK
jgi:hypothetical protein